MTDAPTTPSPERQPADAGGESPGDMLARLGMDGLLWSEEFSKTATSLGYPKMDEGWLLGWFCNAIMAGYDHARRKYDPEIKAQLAALSTLAPSPQPTSAGGELLPCPFCGHTDHETEHLEGTILKPAFRVSCGFCGASTGFSDRGDHASEWNRRAPAPQAQPDARAVEALRLVKTLADKGERTPGCDGWRAAEMCRQIADLADKALSAPAADDGWRPTHRHRGGMECKVIGTAQVQTVTSLCDYDEVTIYREEDGTMWARGSDEFNDGRFLALHPAAPTDAEERS